MVVTDEELARPRDLLSVVAMAVRAGAPAVQLRVKSAGARRLVELGRAMMPVVRRAGALFFVNDRLDVALALGADGVHLGPDDLPVAAARRAVSGRRPSPEGAPDDGTAPGRFLIGASTDDPDEARRLVTAGADYIGCGTVYPTSTKADAGRAIGPSGLQRVAAAVDVPVVGIGGIDVGRSADIASGTTAAGIAVVGAVMRAPDVFGTVQALLEPWRR